MTTAFIVLDAAHSTGEKYLLPVDNLIIQQNVWPTNKFLPKRPPYVTATTVAKQNISIQQDFETLKAILTSAGIKVIESPLTPEGDRTLKVGEAPSNG